MKRTVASLMLAIMTLLVVVTPASASVDDRHDAVLIEEYTESTPPLPTHVWTEHDENTLQGFYATLLGRWYDATGYDYWRSHVEAGYIVVDDVQFFIMMSDEFRTRIGLLPFCRTDEFGPEFPDCLWYASIQGNNKGRDGIRLNGEWFNVHKGLSPF